MIALEKRPQPSRGWSLATPVLAVVATMVFGGLLFAALGKNPFVAIETIFWEPLFGEYAFYYRPQLLVKGAPLVLIAIGLSLGFKAGIWNIGAEGQYIIGALTGAGVGLKRCRSCSGHPCWSAAWQTPALYLPSTNQS